MKKILLPTLMFTLSFPMLSCAASFDCAKASSATEKMICSDENISKLDEQLAASYKRGLGATPDKEDFKKIQLDWLRQQRACKDVACLTQAYQNRLDQLNGSPSAKPIYVLTKGQQYEVCRVFTDYLNSPYYKKGDCSIKDYPADKRLRSPEYKQVDIFQYEDYFIAKSSTRTKEENDRIAQYIKEMDKSGELTAWIATVDVKNDGNKENVLSRRRYWTQEKAKNQFCDGLGGGMHRLVNGKIDDSAWDGGLLGEPILFDRRTYLLSPDGGRNELQYILYEPASSTGKYRNNQHYYGEVSIIDVCNIKSEKTIQY